MRISKRLRFLLILLGIFGIGFALGIIVGIYIPIEYASIIPTITVGGGLGLVYLFRDLFKDILRSINKPSLRYGDIIVNKTVSEQHDGEYQYYTYQLEIKNETPNSTAEDCRATVDLSSLNLGRYYGAWEISKEPSIPIAHDASLKLFTRSEFMKRDHSQSQSNIHFILRSVPSGDIINHPCEYDEAILQKELKISIQSTNADFPTPCIKSIRDIIDGVGKEMTA